MDITVDQIKDPVDRKYYYDAYTVHLDDHRILTIFIVDDRALSKYLNSLLKTTNLDKNTLLVGLTVDRRRRGNYSGSPYELLQLCTGSHCLLYLLPDPDRYIPPRALCEFFNNDKVITVGPNMKSIAESLARDQDMKFKRVVDLRELAVEKTKRITELTNCFNLDSLVEKILGSHMYVRKPRIRPVEWYEADPGWSADPHLTDEKVGYATADAYLCFKTAFELFHMTPPKDPVLFVKRKVTRMGKNMLRNYKKEEKVKKKEKHRNVNKDFDDFVIY